jgi:hypothetical protein
MKQFYETYQFDTKLSPLVRELPWTHNTIIFSPLVSQFEGKERLAEQKLLKDKTK